MLQVCRRNMAQAPGTAELDYVRGDALTMPFGAEFDLVVCFGALGHNLPRDEPRFVAEVARVLRPGGRFVFVTSYLPPVWSGRYWFARLFNLAMTVRNFLLAPPFIMYYLTFLLPGARRLLEKQGLAVEERALDFSGLSQGQSEFRRPMTAALGVPAALRGLRLVVGTKPAMQVISP
jgi:SAM-dependent methyltransferase